MNTDSKRFVFPDHLHIDILSPDESIKTSHQFKLEPRSVAIHAPQEMVMECKQGVSTTSVGGDALLDSCLAVNAKEWNCNILKLALDTTTNQLFLSETSKLERRILKMLLDRDPLFS